jgi:hypothetical protein
MEAAKEWIVYSIGAFIIDLKPQPGQHVDIYFMKETMCEYGTPIAFILPLLVVIHEPSESKGRWIYRKELIQMLKSKSPGWNDVRIVARGKKITPGLNLLRVYIGENYPHPKQPFAHCDTRQHFPNPEIAQALINKYGNEILESPTRTDMYEASYSMTGCVNKL